MYHLLDCIDVWIGNNLGNSIGYIGYIFTFLPYLIFGWLNVIHMFLICEWSNGRNVFFSCFNGRTQIGRYRYMGLNQGYRIMG